MVVMVNTENDVIHEYFSINARQPLIISLQAKKHNYELKVGYKPLEECVSIFFFLLDTCEYPGMGSKKKEYREYLILHKENNRKEYFSSKNKYMINSQSL